MKKIYVFFFVIGLTTQITFAQNSPNIQLAYHWNDSTLPTALGTQRFNDVWGYWQNGIEYGIIGSTNGIHFIKIPDSSGVAVEVDFVPGKAQGGNIIHRDMKSYKNYLYAVADEGQSSLQVIDMSYLPDSVHVVYDSDSILVTAHNLFVDTAQERLYAFGVKAYPKPPDFDISHAMFVISIEFPHAPYYIGKFDDPYYTYVHDGYIYNDTAILNCGNKGLYVGDFTDPNNPVPIGFLDNYPEEGYNHSGWLSEDRSLYIMSDETHGMDMKAVPFTSPDSLVVCQLFGETASDSLAIPHNQMIRGDYLFVSHYYQGLRVYNISNPCNVVSAGFYDTYPGNSDGSYKGAWGVFSDLPSGHILISDMQTGLYIFDTPFFDSHIGNKPEPKTINAVKIYPNPATNGLVTLQADAGINSVKIFDITGKLMSNRLYDEKTQVTLPTTNLQNGIYIVQCTGKYGNIFTKKLIVAR